MEGIEPLGFDDREVTLPDVVWGWHDASTPPATTSGPQETSVLELLGRGGGLVLPVVSQPPSPSRDAADSPTRRKRSSVSSFFSGLKGSMNSMNTASSASHPDQAPPILAALESVSTSYKRPEDSVSPSSSASPPKHALVPLCMARDVATFRFGVERDASPVQGSPSPSPPKHSPDNGSGVRTRHRLHSVSGSISPLDLRMDPVASSSPDAPTKSPTRHRRPTNTTIQRQTLLAAVVQSTTATTASAASNYSCADDHHEDSLDLDPETSHVDVRMHLHSLAAPPDASSVQTIDPDPEFAHPESLTCKSPRNLPPLASSPGKPPSTTTNSTGSSNTSTHASPRKLRHSLSAKDVTDLNGTTPADALPVCAACGKRVYPSNVSLALDALHVVHRACFRCVSCQEPLTPANFHRISTPSDGARFVCTTHYVERLDAKQSGEYLHTVPPRYGC